MEGQQAGVNTFQWTVLRDQFANFARELAIVRNEVSACAMWRRRTKCGTPSSSACC